MQAATLQSKKAVKKGKIKKTIKNVLCRPDPVFWPLVSDEQKKQLEIDLNKYKIDIPKWKKPLWKELKDIPKDKRPKPPKITKPDGLLFGISECSHAIANSGCAAVMVESTVNPRSIIQPLIESCAMANIPVVCINDLKGISTSNFGIPTCCLGIKSDCLPDLKSKVMEIAKTFTLPEPKNHPEPVENMHIDIPEKESTRELPPPIQCPCPYLFRTNKKTRAFTPDEGKASETVNSFRGQDFIEFLAKTNSQQIGRKTYKKMMLQRITNNPNRVKVK